MTMDDLCKAARLIADVEISGDTSVLDRLGIRFYEVYGIPFCSYRPGFDERGAICPYDD